ncbi:MAG TPA: YdeI/OmpD-associated family protein [Gaiellales bacterium]|nr:YdeI/OmpD-associated family protein [Gaiellales bacterium]
MERPDELQGLPVLPFETVREWRDWLSAQPEGARGLWVRFARSGSGIASITHAEALEEALCDGWIDGQVRRLDDRWWAQRFGPRTARSRWSKVNREAAERLIDQGRMRPGGLREVERAKADGRWVAAYDPPSRARVPEDLAAALAVSPEAARFFEALDSRNRYSVLHRVEAAKRPETRARRIAQFVAMLERGEKLYP